MKLLVCSQEIVLRKINCEIMSQEQITKTVKFSLTILLIINLSSGFSQTTLFQTIKGTVVDTESKIPLIGATLIVEGIEPVLGTITDLDGNFTLEKVPVGRHNIKVTYIGYNPYLASEILISSGKELVLNIELKASITSLSQFIFNGNLDKSKPSNSMATTSARTFSVEESSRYAGGLDDPARLASAFAGVATTQTTNNAIIIRGNSPRGVLWRIEGVDVPTAFHFPNVDFIGGGGYTILSSQMLRNSDFYTGAFPAEYGNAVSGVFDIKMRSGNSGKREFTTGIGTSGIDLSSEGPFVKGKKPTYLFNYRYSTLALLGKLTNFPNLPTFQDFTFKLNFPTAKQGTFSLWAMGADDTNIKKADADTLNWLTDYDRTGQRYSNRFGVIGFSHRISLGAKTFIHTTASADGMRYMMKKEEYTFDSRLLPTDYIKSTEGKFSLRSTINYKFNQKVNSRSGFTLNKLFFDNRLDKAFRDKPELMTTFVNSKGIGFSAQAFSQFKIDISQNLAANIGFHSMFLDINRKASFEPRIGMIWNISRKTELSFAYGMHSQMEELRTYHSQVMVNGKAETPNTKLDFMKSNHYILGFNHTINDFLRVKIEPYYQILSDVPVYANSSFSIINITSNWAVNEKLENTGSGKNYGIDITVERFIKDGLYYLFSATIFDSKYKGSNGKEYNTAFNRGFVFNLLAGKEWTINNNHLLGVNAKITYMGGLRYSPALYKESINAQLYIPDYSKAYEGQFPASSVVDLSLTYRINKAKYSGVWYLMVKNVLLQPDYGDPYYDFVTKDVIIDKMKMPFPHIGYKIEF